MHGKRMEVSVFLSVLRRVKNIKKIQERADRPCLVCGSKMDSRKLSYCSKSCRDKSDVTQKIRRSVGRAYQAAKRATTVVQFDPLDVLKRDKWTCQLCKVKTPQMLRGTYDPRAPEVDHIIPLSKQGPHTLWNTQCLCRKCNRSKSNKTIAGQLGLAF